MEEMQEPKLMSYLDPRKFFLTIADVDLSRLLVLIPSYSGLELDTSAFLESLQAVGASAKLSFGISDISLHRCSLAGQAREILRKHPELKYVLWLDGDMVGSPFHVALMQLILDTNESFGCISGIYCKRGNSSVLTVRRQVDERAMIVGLNSCEGKRIIVPMYPVLAGMGALMVRSDVFLAHCDSVPQIQEIKNRHPFPAICASGPVKDLSGRIGWSSEDQTYCSSLWMGGCGVYAAPIVFAHMSKVPLVPSADAKWLNVEPSAPNEIDPPAPTEPCLPCV